MFFLRRPSERDIERFLAESRDLPLSYQPVGVVREGPQGRYDEAIVAIGRGSDDFARARRALLEWRQFDLGWLDLFPRGASVEVGRVVAVRIRHAGLWSLNGARVVYVTGDGEHRHRFGFAYGTLTNHAETGEELFEVFLNETSSDVMYRIRAVSRPQAVLAAIGQPLVRLLQAKFRRDSAAAMRRAVLSR